MNKLFIATTLVLALSNCSSSWVQLTIEGEGVIQLPLASASNCTRIGSTRSSTLNKMLFLDRNRVRLELELVTLARNEAGTMGGDAVVAESAIADGQQRFGVYRC
ncbi:MAG: hypothetical protein ACI95C_001166 [Pseudohongiellaceae bacterium]|jgi:hypothetical protein